MASDSCSILIAGCDYTDEWLSEPLSLLCSSSSSVGGGRGRVSILYHFISSSPSFYAWRWSMDESENTGLTGVGGMGGWVADFSKSLK